MVVVEEESAALWVGVVLVGVPVFVLVLVLGCVSPPNICPINNNGL